MLEVLRHPQFRRLFTAQLVALVGTGLATVALALLAYDLAGPSAGAVLGTALAIKMVVYVLLSPLSGAMVPLNLRKPVLVALDLVRAAVALTLPFVTEIWQVYVLIALLQSASACFTPLFQALIPEILKEERDYTRALSLSRLAYDLESLLSPALAAALLTLVSFHGLFAGTSIGFVLSAVLVVTTAFPVAQAASRTGSPYHRALRGMRIYLHTPRLRGLLALNLCAAAGGAMVFVNTVVIVRSELGGGEREVAWLLAAFGIGSMLMALSLPWVLDRRSDRQVMLVGGAAMAALLLAAASYWFVSGGHVRWSLVVPTWTALGLAYAALVTPGGRLLRRSASEEDLPFLFAAQFSLSHACWLIAYPLAGWIGARFGLAVALLGLASMAVLGTLFASITWRRGDERVSSA
ncbi:MFS transporter [Pseudoxanthomonas kaohsiungensis]|uniref:MFS transporter n=1 Tax=Pseudoxanthomonas kaohsiungensis TaxID=283923 RepID=A0ABW3M2Q0_9GAMM|nr:MFS transporter [Pseudoxanthomonas kaohsiungensis]KAF1705433.1 MFS transporter [Pseudoxanthomonas kaohsiungensis]